jgi:alanine dehydrogenase
MTLWLSNEDVQQVLDMKTAMNQLEVSYLGLTNGNSIERFPYRVTTSKPLEKPWHYFWFRTIEGGVGDYWGIRIFPQVSSYPEVNGVRRRVSLPIEEGLFCGFVLLFDTRSGELVAGMNDGYLNWLATGGTTGLGLKYQVRRDANVAGMLGAGHFGRAVFSAAYEGHHFDEARIYAPTYEHAVAFAKEMGTEFGINARAVKNAEQAVRGSDIVMCATNSSRPVIDGNWLDRGTSVSSIVADNLKLRTSESKEPKYVIFRREVDDETIRRAGTIMACSKAGAEFDQQTELYEAIKVRGLSNWDNVVELPDVVAGKSKGRKTEDEITLFKQNVNGIWYAALGSYAFQEAKKRGLGKEIDRQLFLEKFKP